jgi:hypothetical protein
MDVVGRIFSDFSVSSIKSSTLWKIKIRLEGVFWTEARSRVIHARAHVQVRTLAKIIIR